MNFSQDIQNSIVCSAENRKLLQEDHKCDRYDYLVAVTCGVIGGFVDIFFVNASGDSKLGRWTDAQVNNAVKQFAKLSGWNPLPWQSKDTAGAIRFLEKKFPVNYDHRYSSDVHNLFPMTTRDHHMMSLAHSPDILGLFFSVLNQFTSTASFSANGQLITINTSTYELQGGNAVSKIFCGIFNWFGHIMSDIAGSSASKANAGRGSGIAIPFYELFNFCQFGNFNVGQEKQNLAQIAVRAFQEGYDFRHGMTMAIPVVITDMAIRLIWALRRHFQYGKPFNECIPSQQHSDLRVMLLFGNGTLCVIDGVDAVLRSRGNFLIFFQRFNLIAWFRFVVLVLKEIYIRLDISMPMDYLASYQRINESLSLYLHELEKLDIKRFRKETENYNHIAERLKQANTQEELNKVLCEIFQTMGIKTPWQGDFNQHMSDKNASLIFK